MTMQDFLMNRKYWFISVHIYDFFKLHTLSRIIWNSVYLMVLFRLTIYDEVPSEEIRKVIAEINQHIYLYSIHFTSN